MQPLLLLASVLAGLAGAVPLWALPLGPDGEPVDAAAAAAAAPLVARQGGISATSNQLTDGTPCRAVTVIYARGTTEAGNLGTLGPLFLNELAAAVGAGNLAVQGVNYPASVGGFLLGGDPSGSTLMAQLAAQAQQKCPQTKLVLSGYSQGGQLVHKAADQISSSVTNFVSAVLVFGDPNNGSAFGKIPASKTKVICHALDGICLHTVIVTADHLNYAQDAPAAAAWVAKQLGY